MWSFFSRDSSKDFPYEIGECVAGLDAKSVWSLHKGKRKGTNEEVSIFVYDIKNGSDTKLEITKCSVKRLKTLRHPSVLQFLDSFETDKVLYVATEYVQPLGCYIESLNGESPQNDLYLSWGIFQITVSVIPQPHVMTYVHCANSVCYSRRSIFLFACLPIEFSSQFIISILHREHYRF